MGNGPLFKQREKTIQENVRGHSGEAHAAQKAETELRRPKPNQEGLGPNQEGRGRTKKAEAKLRRPRPKYEGRGRCKHAIS